MRHVADPVLHELETPFLANRVEKERADVGVQYVVTFCARPDNKRIPRIIAPQPGSDPYEEPEEVSE